MVVLADRLVGRSRRTTRGLERAGSDELSETRLGLAPSPSRGEGAKERWKPGPGWQNLGSVAGPRSRFGAQASDRAGIRRWKASGRDRVGAFDEASRVAAPVGGCAPRRPLVLVRTSEEDDSLDTRKKTPRARGRSPRGPRSGPHQDRAAPAKQAPRPRKRHEAPAERRVRASEARGAPSIAP